MTGTYPHFLRDESWKKHQNVKSFFLVADPLQLLLLNVCFSGDETGRFVGILDADVDNFFLLHQTVATAITATATADSSQVYKSSLRPCKRFPEAC